MVEQVEAGVGRGLVLQVVAHAQPRLRGAVGVLAGVVELLLVELLACELLEILDRVVELGADVGDVVVVDLDGIIIRYVDHDQGDVAHTGDVLIPLGHAVADVVAAQHEVRLGNAHLLIGLDGVEPQLLLTALGQRFDLMDIVDDDIGLHGLGVLLGLAGRLVDDDVAVLVLERLAARRVNDELAGSKVDLAAGALARRVSKADAGIAADVVVEAEILGGLAHDLAVALGGDAGGLVLGVHDVQVERLRQLAGELGAGPADQLALLLGFAGVGIDVVHDLAQREYAGAYFFGHNNLLLFRIMYYLLAF